MLQWKNIDKALAAFLGQKPFDHCIVDGFLEDDVADILENEFPDYDSDAWYVYKNALENKKALNNWNAFPPTTYKLFCELNSPAMVERLERILDKNLYIDQGLHGAGWHIHGMGGNLNAHLDYSIHPKMSKERNINIIIYMSRDLKEEHGGHLGLWEHDVEKKCPAALIKKVRPVFNRAVIFNTTQNSWHGMCQPLTQTEGVYRKSLAVYYLCDPTATTSSRQRALYAPRQEQKNDQAILDLIKKRVGLETSNDVYID